MGYEDFIRNYLQQLTGSEDQSSTGQDSPYYGTMTQIGGSTGGGSQLDNSWTTPPGTGDTSSDLVRQYDNGGTILPSWSPIQPEEPSFPSLDTGAQLTPTGAIMGTPPAPGGTGASGTDTTGAIMGTAPNPNAPAVIMGTAPAPLPYGYNPEDQTPEQIQAAAAAQAPILAASAAEPVNKPGIGSGLGNAGAGNTPFDWYGGDPAQFAAWLAQNPNYDPSQAAGKGFLASDPQAAAMEALYRQYGPLNNLSTSFRQYLINQVVPGLLTNQQILATMPEGTSGSLAGAGAPNTYQALSDLVSNGGAFSTGAARSNLSTLLGNPAAQKYIEQNPTAIYNLLVRTMNPTSPLYDYMNNAFNRQQILGAQAGGDLRSYLRSLFGV